MTTGIRSDASGTFGALTFGVVDSVTFDAAGIQAGSYKAGSIGATELSNTALLGTSAKPIGYSGGGTVTQATSKSTAVTLNKPCGQITMNGGALAASTTVVFVFNNSLISAADNVVVTLQNSGLANGNYQVWVTSVIAGAAVIAVRNMSAGSLSEAIPINFAIIKGASA